MAFQLVQQQRAQYLRAIFDGIPLPSFIVDSDVRIQDLNTAAEEFLGGEPGAALHCRGGDAFRCLHAQPNGCGRSEACQECVIRNSVASALRGMNKVREPHQANLSTEAGVASLNLLVTASLLPYTEPAQALLILERGPDHRTHLASAQP